MGEDVGRYGGCYAVSKGLLQEFGEERIRDTPLSESAFVGAGIGAALGRHAADRRDHDGELQPAGARPDPQQRRHHPPHVGRAVRRAAGDPHGHRRGPAARGPALAQPGRLVCAHSRPADGGPGDARGCARHAGSALAGSRSGADLRARQALQHGRRAAAGCRPGGPRPGGLRRPGRDVASHLRRQPAQAPGRRRAARGRRHRGRSDRPADPAAAR